MSEITDEYMTTMLTRSAPYSVMILERGPAYGSAGSDAIVWEHGRRNFELRAAGLLAVAARCPTTPRSAASASSPSPPTR
jgi:hypothetical protein